MLLKRALLLLNWCNAGCDSFFTNRTGPVGGQGVLYRGYDEFIKLCGKFWQRPGKTPRCVDSNVVPRFLLLGDSAWKVCKMEIETGEKLNLKHAHTTWKLGVGVATERYA